MEGMLMLLDDLKQKIKKDEIEYLDLRFTDLLGKEQHVSIPVTSLDDNLLQHGKGIDGSSLSGWQDINHSDLSLKPELTALNPMDPFYRAKTLLLRCDVIDPTTGENYSLCPRVIAKNAEHYLKSTGIADSILFGPVTL
jgi:glutamine synthetase